MRHVPVRMTEAEEEDTAEAVMVEGEMTEDALVNMTLQTEVIHHLEKFVEKQLCLLKPVEDCWQPSDILPKLTDPDGVQELHALRERALTLSDEVLVVLVGNLITEEALPSYQTWLNRFEGFKDK